MLHTKCRLLGESHSEICPSLPSHTETLRVLVVCFFVCHFPLRGIFASFFHMVLYDSLAGPALKPGKCLSWIQPYLDVELFSCRFLFHICLQSLPHCLCQITCLSSSALKLSAPPSLNKCCWPFNTILGFSSALFYEEVPQSNECKMLLYYFSFVFNISSLLKLEFTFLILVTEIKKLPAKLTEGALFQIQNCYSNYTEYDWNTSRTF